MNVSYGDDALPLAAADVESALFEGRAVLYREATRALHHLNATAAAVWVCCDGETPVHSIVTELASLFRADVARTHLRVVETLEELNAIGLLSPAPAPTLAAAIQPTATDGSRLIACPPDT